MNKKSVLAFLLMLMVGYGSAFNVEYRVYNFNTLQPISSVNITLDNSTKTISQLTDIYGITTFSIDNSTNNITGSKSGYTGYIGLNKTFNGDTTESFYLMQLSTDGIIKLTINDLTLSSHKICLYYDNNRLEGCYDSNDTITIHNNVNYTIMPYINKMDLINNPDSYWLYIPSLLGIGGLIIFIVVIIVLIIGMYHILRGKK